MKNLKGPKNYLETLAIILLVVWRSLVFLIISTYVVFLIPVENTLFDYVITTLFFIFSFPFVFVLYSASEIINNKIINRLKGIRRLYLYQHIIPGIVHLLIIFCSSFLFLNTDNVILPLLLTYLLLFLYSKIYLIIQMKFKNKKLFV